MDHAQLLSMADACRKLGLARRTLTGYIAAGAPHTKERGRLRFDESAVLRWMVETGRSGKSGTQVATGLPAGQEHVEAMARVDLRIRELEVQKRGRLEAQARGELLDSREVTEAWSAAGTAFRGVLESLPARLSGQLVGQDRKTIQRMLKAALEAARGTLPARAPGVR